MVIRWVEGTGYTYTCIRDTGRAAHTCGCGRPVSAEFLPTDLDKNQRFAKLLKVLLKMTPAISNKD